MCIGYLPTHSYYIYTRESHYPHPPSRVATHTQHSDPTLTDCHTQHSAPPSRVLAPKRHSRTTDYPSTSWVPAPTKHRRTTGCLSTSWVLAPTKYLPLLVGSSVHEYSPPHHGLPHTTLHPLLAGTRTYPPLLAGSSVHEYSSLAPRVTPAPRGYPRLQNTSPASWVLAPTKHRPHPRGYPRLPTTAPSSRVLAPTKHLPLLAGLGGKQCRNRLTEMGRERTAKENNESEICDFLCRKSPR